MAPGLLAGGVAAALAIASPPRESRIPVGKTSLYAREIGGGPPVIVLHGGPDFDHGYLLPDLDRLADAYRLIYYDQRGRGRSAEGVEPEEVTLSSDVEDLDKVRKQYRLEASALLGHSWGAVLALEYALRYPSRVSHLVLMNPAPASAADLRAFRQVYIKKLGPDMDRQREIVAGPPYQSGEPEAVTARYRLHFKPALKRAEDYEKLMANMRVGFLRQGKEGIVKARAVEERLMADTWERDGYDLLPKLSGLRIPTLVIAGEQDFFPVAIAEHIAQAIPKARLVTLADCGHFAYLECPGEVRRALDDLFGSPTPELVGELLDDPLGDRVRHHQDVIVHSVEGTDILLPIFLQPRDDFVRRRREVLLH
jgi:proline iminopeptidase